MKVKHRKYFSVSLTLLIAISGLTGCSNKQNTTDSAKKDTTAYSLTGITVKYSSEDLDTSWDASTASNITLNGDSIDISGSGASVEGSTLTITDGGTYVLSGKLNDGQIIVDAEKTDTVRLVLNGADLNCSDSAAIYSKQSKKTILTLAKDTSNTVTDGTTYNYATGEDEPNATIFSKDNLTVNGSGSLTVNGKFNHGIVSKDDLVITGGDISVTSVNDGLRGKDSVAIKDGNFAIQAGGDGIQANNDQDAEKGWISLDGGTFNITSANDGIQAETILQVTSGKLDIITGNGSASNERLNKPTEPIKPGKDSIDNGKFDSGEKFNSNNVDASDGKETSDENTVSTKGIKGGTGIIVNSGTLNIDSYDDSIHSNGDLLINNGEFILSSGDDAIHANNQLIIENGFIDISKSYEGIEGKTVTINDGNIKLNTSDDGINASDPDDTSDGRPGQSNDSCFIRITGGEILVSADGDGIDSNGNIYFDGGNIVANGPTNNGNGVLDYDGTCEITGGTLAVAGSSGMAQTPADNSSQNSLAVYYSSTQKAGTKVTLADEKGNSIYSFIPSKEYQFIVISTPDLEKGKTYTLLSGTTKLTDVTLSDAVTSISEDGSKVSGGMKGGMNRPPHDGENGGKMPPDGSNMPQGGPPDMPQGGGEVPQDKSTQIDNN